MNIFRFEEEIMTCIVGWAEKGNVWIGGDSAGVAGYFLQVRADEKVFKKEEFVFGFTSSFRMGQLIRYKLSIPKPEEKQDINDYLHAKFLDAVIKCFKDNSYGKEKDGERFGGTFLFGFRGKLYQVDDDFQIGKSLRNFDSVGCGCQIALGCLYGVAGRRNVSPNQKLLTALRASQEFSAGVREPFHIVSTKDE
jgi:hypothetical protein